MYKDVYHSIVQGSKELDIFVSSPGEWVSKIWWMLTTDYAAVWSSRVDVHIATWIEYKKLWWWKRGNKMRCIMLLIFLLKFIHTKQCKFCRAHKKEG